MEPVNTGSMPNAASDNFDDTTVSRPGLPDQDSSTAGAGNPVSSNAVLSGKNNKDCINEYDDNAGVNNLLRLSIKEGEYTYAKADDIIMIESSDHLTIVHIARQTGKVKRTIRNTCLKEFIAELPANYFLRVNRFCAVNLKRLSGGSYHGQSFEFDHCIIVKPKRPISHSVFNSIGK